MPSLALDRSTVHYEDLGESRAGMPALVLLHGFPLDGRVWMSVADQLKSKTRVIVPDLPGFGRSSVSGSFSIESLADDVETLVARLRAGPFVLAGLSMGGYIALALGRKSGAMLRGLVLTNTKSGADDEAGKAKRNSMIEIVKARGTPAIVDLMLPNMLEPDAAKDKSDVVSQLKSIMLDCPQRTIEIALTAMRDRADYTELLVKLDIPVLVVHGTADAIMPESSARKMSEQTRNGSFVGIEHAGHLSTMEQPQAVADVITKFLEEIGATS
ncbi:MAG TPA: alpha/beta hydrolase [Tepidisphaeraceae bacterium]|nr:alpha/beta hydrolase [Tepidisphaeraceae bacterium]